MMVSEPALRFALPFLSLSVTFAMGSGFTSCLVMLMVRLVLMLFGF